MSLDGNKSPLQCCCFPEAPAPPFKWGLNHCISASAVSEPGTAHGKVRAFLDFLPNRQESVEQESVWVSAGSGFGGSAVLVVQGFKGGVGSVVGAVAWAKMQPVV